MKRKLLAVSLVAGMTCLLARTVIDYDHFVNFANYHTYSWAGVNVPESLWKDRVTNAIDNQLLRKGWRRIDNDADATVIAVGSAHTEQTVETFYNGIPGRWAHRGWPWGPGYTTITIDRVRVGGLHIDIFDAHTKKVIWHATASDTLAGDPEKNQKKLNKAVAEAFKKFPPPAKD